MGKKYAFNTIKKPLRFLPVLLCLTLAASSVIICQIKAATLYLNAENISGSVVRLHIRANSDSAADQSVKLAVRNRIISEYSNDLIKLSDKSAGVKYLKARTDEIKSLAETVLTENGFDYKANVKISETDFPDRSYNGLIFGKGQYTALTVDLGEGTGKNWWCVLYPPLCFIGVREENAETSSETAESETEETENGKKTIKVRSLIAEWLGW